LVKKYKQILKFFENQQCLGLKITDFFETALKNILNFLDPKILGFEDFKYFVISIPKFTKLNSKSKPKIDFGFGYGFLSCYPRPRPIT